MKQALEQALQQAVESLLQEHPHAAHVRVQLTRPKVAAHGDYACNVAMPLAGVLKQKPQAIAATILETVRWPDAVDAAEIAGPGFINIRLKKASEASVLRKIVQLGCAYGRTEASGAAEKVNVEFVSANPTGPMHVGHGRGA
ncbi:MAG: arginine--tRNA ligase, partial [Mariprofundaceae bacterium]